MWLGGRFVDISKYLHVRGRRHVAGDDASEYISPSYPIGRLALLIGALTVIVVVVLVVFT